MLGFDEADPGRYALEYAICKEMGWSWGDLLSTPFDFVDEIGERIQLRVKWQAEKEKLDRGKKKK